MGQVELFEAIHGFKRWFLVAEAILPNLLVLLLLVRREQFVDYVAVFVVEVVAGQVDLLDAGRGRQTGQQSRENLHLIDYVVESQLLEGFAAEHTCVKPGSTRLRHPEPDQGELFKCPCVLQIGLERLH